jgi:O-antigen/teichoic acid export membrane protein
MLSGVITTGLGFLIAAVKYPLYLHFLGYEIYGIWLLLSTILTFAQLGLVGIGPALMKFVAEEYAHDNTMAVQEYITTALMVLLVVGAAILSMFALFKWQIVLFLGLAGEGAELAAGLLVYMGLLSIGVLLYQVLNASLSGVGRMDLANYFQNVVQVIPLLIAVPLLLTGKGVSSLLIGNAFGYFVVAVVNFIILKRVAGLGLITPKYISWDRFRALISFGGSVFAGSSLSMITLPLSKIAITRFAGVGDVPIYEVAYRIGMQVRGVFEVAFRAIMPEVSKMNSAGTIESNKKIRNLNSKAYKLIFWTAPLLYTMLFIIADVIFKVWFGGKYEPAIPSVFRIILIGSFLSSIGLVSYNNLMGKGMVREIFLFHLIYTVGNLLLLGAIIYVSADLHLLTYEYR